MKLTLPLERRVSTNRIYAGMHWKTRSSFTHHFHELVEKEWRADGLQQIFWKPRYPVSITMIFYFKNRPYDPSNCFPMVKMLEDGLVKAGIIYDDDPQHVEFIGCMSKVDEENPRIEISIEERG